MVAPSSTDPNAPEGVLRKDTVDWIVSADFVLPRNAKLNVQAFQRWYNGGEDTLAIQSGDFGVSALISGKVTPTVEPQLLWIQAFGGGGGLVRPRVNWTPLRNTTIGVGRHLHRSRRRVLRRYNSDQVYTELRYDF
jgi:hypothetical protein